MHMYRFWGTGSALPSLGMADLLEKGVIVSTINSLYKVLKKDRKQLERLGNVTSCIVIDEAHRSVSPMYSYVLEEMGFKWGRRKAEISSLGTILIGLTATPFRGRGDNEETRMLLRRYNGVYYPEIPVGSIDGNFLPHAIYRLPARCNCRGGGLDTWRKVVRSGRSHSKMGVERIRILRRRRRRHCQRRTEQYGGYARRRELESGIVR